MWRPVERGLCKAESLFDGTFDLCDIARMNEVIDISLENQARANAAAEKNNGR
ncbi:hypothetical protein [Methylobacterium sp. CCH5-D2]|uniref:DUF6889 family protein n=1 Tax=Methylobacterium sp. CCH5-D2 TaxID=1768765 RepID=UPI000ADB9B44|nr:hypothetical protein [Methylobacterium sp. CCH5-D2]